MYNYPENFKIELFVGCRLESISVAIHHLVFHFDDNIEIQIEGEIEELESKNSKNLYSPDKTFIDTSVFSYIEGTVIAAEIEPTQSLILRFEHDKLIRILASNQYESFHIRFQHQTVTI
jgi:Family of unknown function (DUF6188)